MPTPRESTRSQRFHLMRTVAATQRVLAEARAERRALGDAADARLLQGGSEEH
jgi:hypothetical protein